MSKSTPVNTVDLADAIDWVNRWRNSTCAERDPFQLKGFLVPMIDVIQIIQEQGSANIRTYMAINPNDEYKMLLVGVDAAGNDMINPSQGWYIYDLTQPCPPVCGVGPLSSGKPPRPPKEG